VLKVTVNFLSCRLRPACALRACVTGSTVNVKHDVVEHPHLLENELAGLEEVKPRLDNCTPQTTQKPGLSR